MGGGFWGVVLGAGGPYVRQNTAEKWRGFKPAGTAGAVFATTRIWWALTKSKGRVTEADIHIASSPVDGSYGYGDCIASRALKRPFGSEKRMSTHYVKRCGSFVASASGVLI